MEGHLHYTKADPTRPDQTRPTPTVSTVTTPLFFPFSLFFLFLLLLSLTHSSRRDRDRDRDRKNLEPQLPFTTTMLYSPVGTQCLHVFNTHLERLGGIVFGFAPSNHHNKTTCTIRRSSFIHRSPPSPPNLDGASSRGYTVAVSLGNQSQLLPLIPYRSIP